MQGTLRRIRLRTSRTPFPWAASSQTTIPALQNAPPRPVIPEARAIESTKSSRALHQSAPQDSNPSQWPATSSETLGHAPKSTGWPEIPQSEQEGGQHDNRALQPIRGLLQRNAAALSSEDLKGWDRLLLDTRRKHGNEGVWEAFQLMQTNKATHLLAHAHAKPLRDEIVAAALGSKTQIAELVEVARTLSFDQESWPNLYFDIVHHLLDTGCFDDAVLWHLRLAPLFPPDADVFGTLLTNFAVDQTPKMQSSLTTMYIFNTERRLYDHIIPALYTSGQSNLARAWRQTLLGYSDFPSTLKSLPFLGFLQRYYPRTRLADAEKALLLGSARHPGVSAADDGQHAPALDRPNGIYSDSIVAKWFASSWTTVGFAINLVHRLGLRSIGPRSLQALALRETEAKDIASRIAQLRQLGVNLPPRTYGEAIVWFAETGEDRLLAKLLRCDIHPDEFDNSETRQMLLAAAVRDGDKDMERLLRGIESLVGASFQSDPLHVRLQNELFNSKLAKAKTVVDRMMALNFEIGQKTASLMLRRAFVGIVGNRKFKPQPLSGYLPDGAKPSLDRAIETTLMLAHAGVAIRVRDWRTLIRNLGWAGRLSDLERLCLEVVDLYEPQRGPLMAIHQADVPEPAPLDGLRTPKDRLSSEEKREAQRERMRPEVRELVPSDLPFSHPQHPLSQVFDPTLQMSIVRWGFDKTLASAPRLRSSLIDTKSAKPEQFDLARGVRLLAMLRDRGVAIEKKTLRISLLKRIALSQVPSRSHHRRDSHSLSPMSMKRLLDGAWGSWILPSEAGLPTALERQNRGLWKRYPKLFSKNFEHGECGDRANEYQVGVGGLENSSVRMSSENSEGSDRGVG